MEWIVCGAGPQGSKLARWVGGGSSLTAQRKYRHAVQTPHTDTSVLGFSRMLQLQRCVFVILLCHVTPHTHTAPCRSPFFQFPTISLSPHPPASPTITTTPTAPSHPPPALPGVRLVRAAVLMATGVPASISPSATVSACVCALWLWGVGVDVEGSALTLAPSLPLTRTMPASVVTV